MELDLKMTDERNIAVIKLAAEAYMSEGHSPVKLLLEAAEWLWDCYQKTGDIHCVEAAKQVVCAYVELGLPHENQDASCSRIWDLLRASKKELIPEAFYPKYRLKVNRSQIRQALGPWPRTKSGEMTADDAVKDIIRKIEERTSGVQIYRTKRDEIVFQLVITEDGEAFLLNLQKRLIYTFER